MVIAVIFYELSQKTSGLASLSAVQAVRLINQGARVVDVRDQAQFAAGHIVDATNIPAAELTEEVDKKLKGAKFIILVCDSGARSGKAVAALRKAGNEKVFNLKGGLATWQTENLPIVTPD